MSDIFLFIATKTTVDVAIPTQAFTQADYNRKIANAFRAKSGGQLKVGDLKLRPLSDAIPNHLLCDGSPVSRTQFSELYRLLGDTQGAGDGTTTFNLPNYLGSSLTVPATAPAQTVTTSGTVSTGGTVTAPVSPGQTGGTHGGNVVSGAVESRSRQ